MRDGEVYFFLSAFLVLTAAIVIVYLRERSRQRSDFASIPQEGMAVEMHRMGDASYADSRGTMFLPQGY